MKPIQITAATAFAGIYVGALWWYETYDNPARSPIVRSIASEVARLTPTYHERLADYENCAWRTHCDRTTYEQSLEKIVAQTWVRALISFNTHAWAKDERAKTEEKLYLAALEKGGGDCLPTFTYRVIPGFHIDPQVTGFKCP